MNRQGFIGGSDLYNIMQGNWHDLWLVKTGRKEPEDLSQVFRVQLGSFTEQFNIDWFCQDTGHTIEQTQVEVQRYQRYTIQRHYRCHCPFRRRQANHT